MDFSDFIQQAQRDGVTSKDHYPFHLSASTEIAILLVHGFTASPREMRAIADILHRDGATCMGIRLPGHGTSTQDLARRRWEEWATTVEQGYHHLRKRSQCIFGIGVSTGCLLLLDLALRQAMDGLVLCSPYLRINHPLASHAGWLRFVRPYHPSPADSKNRDGYYRSRPVAGVHQINRLIRHLRGNLGKITTPVLAMNAEGDQTIDFASGHSLFEQLGSPFKTHVCFGPETPHVIITEDSPQRKTAVRLTRQFIRGVSKLASDNDKVPQPDVASTPSTLNCQ